MSSLPEFHTADRPEEKFGEFLSIRGERYTKSRRELVRHIFSYHDHFTADDLVRDTEQTEVRASRATIYRTLLLLVEAGMLKKVPFGDRDRYEHDYGYPEHDHLFCTSCQKIIEFQAEELQEMLDVVARKQGFRAATHRLIISGICSECSRARNSRHKLDLV